MGRRALPLAALLLALALVWAAQCSDAARSLSEDKHKAALDLDVPEVKVDELAPGVQLTTTRHAKGKGRGRGHGHGGRFNGTEHAHNGTEHAHNGTEHAHNGTEPAHNGTEHHHGGRRPGGRKGGKRAGVARAAAAKSGGTVKPDYYGDYGSYDYADYSITWVPFRSSDFDECSSACEDEGSEWLPITGGGDTSYDQAACLVKVNGRILYGLASWNNRDSKYTCYFNSGQRVSKTTRNFMCACMSGCNTPPDYSGGYDYYGGDGSYDGSGDYYSEYDPNGDYYYYDDSDGTGYIKGAKKEGQGKGTSPPPRGGKGKGKGPGTGNGKGRGKGKGPGGKTTPPGGGAGGAKKGGKKGTSYDGSYDYPYPDYSYDDPATCEVDAFWGADSCSRDCRAGCACRVYNDATGAYLIGYTSSRTDRRNGVCRTALGPKRADDYMNFCIDDVV
ncbi:hypothetical protein HT031_006675 [Scenedesmus sp. PABB004]|nr:hypothetical protein HT031_006675 [Scenedesmus sp. PABB004]